MKYSMYHRKRPVIHVDTRSPKKTKPSFQMKTEKKNERNHGEFEKIKTENTNFNE